MLFATLRFSALSFGYIEVVLRAVVCVHVTMTMFFASSEQIEQILRTVRALCMCAPPYSN